MSLSGSLRTMPVEDLLRWASARRRTGSLVFEDPEFATTLYLQEGRIISSSSTNPCFYFGQFLLAHTGLSEEQLRRAFDRQERSRVYVGRNIFMKTLLGKLLVEEGLLDEAEVSRVLRLKIEESLYDVFLWPEGTFRLELGELPPEELVPVSLEVGEVVRHGRDRADRWRTIRARVPSPRTTFEVHPEAIPANAGLAATEARALLLLGEGSCVREVLLALHTTEFAIGEMLLRFEDRGWIRRGAEANIAAPPLGERPQDSPTPRSERGLELFDQRAYADTLVAARQALRQNPTNSDARRLVERSERELTGSLYARWFGPDDVPVRRATPSSESSASLSAEERYLLERVDGQWSIRSLIRLSPLKEVDALAVFKRLIEQGWIGLDRRSDG